VFKAETLVLFNNNNFQYNPEYKVFIYKKYKYTIRGLEMYLKDIYKLKKKEKRLLLDWYNSLFLVKPEDIYILLFYRLLFKVLRDPIPVF
jgi:hypothetical protein